MSMWEKLQTRKTIVKAFKSGNFYLGTPEYPIFPKIHAVTPADKSTIITFSIPNGLDPKILKKNQYIFEQYFGKNIELTGDVKKFILTIYHKGVANVLKYNYETISGSFEGLKLPIVAGVDIQGNIIIYCMVENPHLLIAGETGSGKSTQLRSVLTSLIKTLSPDQLQLFLGDLKRSEFHLFKNIEHVKGVYHTANEIMPVLQYLQSEMRKRGDLLDQYEVAHVDDLPERLPYIVLCIDEVALLQDEKDLMKIIEEISAIGRALGVFLILSMQRPDSKILDGKIKNNLTVVMGFKCSNLINSTIIGTKGSEKLTVKGRMLLKVPIFSELKEVQAPFLSLDEAKKHLMNYKSQKVKHPLESNSEVMELQEIEEDVFGWLEE